ncbi:MAG TPA: CAP domain-containing protein [Thermomicrobiales bacterium]|jgi:hypothetical protein|nr:CAP domain-containing protein [Thermomicrobiales bacterium]
MTFGESESVMRMLERRQLIRVMLVLAVILLVGGIFPGPGLQIGPSSGVVPGAWAGICATAEEMEVLRLVNQRRADYGLPPLILSATLTAAARYHSADMGQNDYFDHTLYDGTPWSQNIRNHGYTYDTWRGENIAAGNSDAASTFMQWVNSPTHDANMLSASFVAIGIGHVATPGSSWTNYWTQTFGGYADGALMGCDGSDPSAGATAPEPAMTPAAPVTLNGRPAQVGASIVPTVTPKPTQPFASPTREPG